MEGKLDLARSDKPYYTAKSTPQILELGPLPYLTIDGRGEPAGPVFVEATQALYPLAYGVKKIMKGEGRDFGVPSLEGLWWVEGDRPALEVPRSEWLWKLLIRMPDFVTADTVAAARPAAAKKAGGGITDRVVLETISEGKCVQIMHVGPYFTEPETLQTLFRFIAEQGLAIRGRHHEIYLSDPRKAAAEKMKTIIRYPVE